MKIIIEGPNNVGKTTLIKNILKMKKFKDFEIEHLSGRTPNTKEFHEDLLKLPQNMIFDRFFIGELIYPEIFNRKSNITEKQVIDLCKKYKNQILIIFIDADYEFIIRSNKNKNEQFNYEEVKKEKEGFYKYKNIFNKIKGLKIISFKNSKENEIEYKEFLNQIDLLGENYEI